jgi:hypothetical protein
MSATGALFAPKVVHAGEQCGPQKLATTVDMKLDYGLPLIPVTVVGSPKNFIVDTGGYVSTLFPAVVRELGLPRRNVALRIVGVDGRTSNTAVRVPEFAIGRLRAADLSFMVDPRSPPDDTPERAPSGLLGPEILQNYDVDFDFTAGKMNLIDSDHCEGQVVYWPASAVAVIPFRLDNSFHVIVPATIDGQRVEAMLDTGASATLLNLNAAQRLFDIDVTGPDMEKAGELQGKAYSANVYRRRFNSIELEGMVINNPTVLLVPDMVRAQLPRGPAPGSLLPDPRNRATGFPELILGMSELSKLHLYIAYKERKLYISSDDTAAISIEPR